MNTTIAHPSEDMAQMRRVAERWLSTPSELPVTYVLDGRPMRGIPAEWRPATNRRHLDANLIETVFEGCDPAGGLRLRVEVLQYLDHPVVEWVAWFTNTGAQTTPILSDVLALDVEFNGEAPVLWHCNGDYYSVDGYTPSETALNPGTSAAFAPAGGRPCDQAFPYYRVRFEDWGFSLAIGWPGQWSARFDGRERGVAIRAGQETTYLRLQPGERIRTPRITMLAWSGEGSRAVNLWRRWYLSHILPRPDGRPLRPLLACAATDDGEEFTAATEANQICYLDKFRARGIHPDVWWIDAGWYPCWTDETRQEKKWWMTGTWMPDPERFPRGLKPVSDRAAEGGADLLVWFEPERICRGRALDREHPDWMLKVKEGNTNLLLNLGDPRCRQEWTDHVCRMIAENGIKIYRQDHNFAPLEYWRFNDAPDRQGMTENLHVQGYLQYWDDLLARNPGLWIDSCASGGRRNDLETMRRSVPLHYTDYGYGDHPVKLAFHRTLYEWIPYFKEFTISWDLGGPRGYQWDRQVDSYSFHCAMAPMLFATLDIRRDDYNFGLAAKMIAIWRRAAELMLHGDYYPHTPFHKSAERWVAWQFDSPETGLGFVQGIRLPKAPEATLTIHPCGIRADADYRFENPETGETLRLTGDVLTHDGFTFALPPRNAAIWLYWTEPSMEGLRS